MPEEFYYCIPSYLFVWAVGSEGEVLPENVGIPIGGPGSTPYYLLEMHYDNPNLTPNIIDSSGLTLYVTEELREEEAAMLMVGGVVSLSHFIPPGQENFIYSTRCLADCTEKVIPPEGIKMIASMLHTHLAGSGVVIRHLRDGVELKPLVEDRNYDFDFQIYRKLDEELTILPGDQFITECIYDSSDRNTPIYGGFPTSSEMCLGFIRYYPKLPFLECCTAPTYENLLLSLGIEDVEIPMPDLEKSFTLQEMVLYEKKVRKSQADTRPPQNPFEALIVKAPPKYEDMTVAEVVDLIDWKDDQVTKTFQDSINYGDQVIYCEGPLSEQITPEEITHYPEFIEYIKPERVCDLDTSTMPSTTGKGSIVTPFLFLLLGIILVDLLVVQ